MRRFRSPLPAGLAIAENGGPITINNTGTIIGQVVVADAAFNNESSGVWDIGGSSGFGSGSGNTIDNAGLIDAVGTAAITDVVLTTEFPARSRRSQAER